MAYIIISYMYAPWIFQPSGRCVLHICIPVSALVIALAGSSSVNPIQKVCALIEKLQHELIQEGRDAQSVYNSFAGMCEDRSRELHREIKSAKGDAHSRELPKYTLDTHLEYVLRVRTPSTHSGYQLRVHLRVRIPSSHPSTCSPSSLSEYALNVLRDISRTFSPQLFNSANGLLNQVFK